MDDESEATQHSPLSLTHPFPRVHAMRAWDVAVRARIHYVWCVTSSRRSWLWPSKCDASLARVVASAASYQPRCVCASRRCDRRRSSARKWRCC